MKNLLSVAFIFFSFNSAMMAQKGFDLRKEITIDVSADQLWEMVGPGFVEVYKWSSNIDYAKGKGTPEFEGAVCNERYCDVNVKGFSSISETLTNYDESNMTLAYEVHEGMPKFITFVENVWTVEPLADGRSKLVMNAKFRMKGLMGSMMKGMMEKKMKDTWTTILNDAKVYAETGLVSVEKAKRMEKLNKKAS